jgi:ferredoxin-thioredoxin reductase catalytic subunit
MKQESTASEYAVDRLYSKLAKESTSSAYFLNPEVDFTRSLIKSLIVRRTLRLFGLSLPFG